MAVRLKKLHESAQVRFEKCRDGLAYSVAQQQPQLTGQPLDDRVHYHAHACQMDCAI